MNTVSSVAGAFALHAIYDSLGRGRAVEIPSIGVRIEAPIYRAKGGHGRVCADFRTTDYLRQWLSEPELWALLESLSLTRLARFGFIVQRAALSAADR